MKKAIKLMIEILHDEYYEGRDNVEISKDGDEERAEKLLSSLLEAIREDGEVRKENEVRGLGLWCGVNLDYIEAESKSPEVNSDLIYRGSGETLYRILIQRGWTPPLK